MDHTSKPTTPRRTRKPAQAPRRPASKAATPTPPKPSLNAPPERAEAGQRRFEELAHLWKHLGWDSREHVPYIAERMLGPAVGVPTRDGYRFNPLGYVGYVWGMLSEREQEAVLHVARAGVALFAVVSADDELASGESDAARRALRPLATIDAGSIADWIGGRP